MSTTETKLAGSMGMSRRESGSADAAGNGEAAGDEDAPMLGDGVGDARLDVGEAAEGGTTAIALGEGPLSLPHPPITTRPTMDRLVRVRFMALAPTVVRRLSFTRIEANRGAKVSPGPRRPGDTPSMANVADRLTR